MREGIRLVQWSELDLVIYRKASKGEVKHELKFKDFLDKEAEARNITNKTLTRSPYSNLKKNICHYINTRMYFSSKYYGYEISIRLKNGV